MFRLVHKSTFGDQKWDESRYHIPAVRGEMFGGNKLRTYRTFKNEFITEPYLSIIVHKEYRSAYAKFRCGVAPLKIETGRYGVNKYQLKNGSVKHAIV